MTEFESYIAKHRDELDVYQPDKSIWTRIERGLMRGDSPEFSSVQSPQLISPPPPDEPVVRPMRRPKLRVLLLLAAAAVAALVIALPLTPAESDFAAPTSAEVLALEDPEVLGPQIADVEAYYQDAISRERARLVSLQREGYALESDFSVNLDRLRFLYKELQAELPYAEDPEAVAEAMVRNLTAQLEILQQQLQILESVKLQREDEPQAPAIY